MSAVARRLDAGEVSRDVEVVPPDGVSVEGLSTRRSSGPRPTVRDLGPLLLDGCERLELVACSLRFVSASYEATSPQASGFQLLGVLRMVEDEALASAAPSPTEPATNLCLVFQLAGELPSAALSEGVARAFGEWLGRCRNSVAAFFREAVARLVALYRSTVGASAYVRRSAGQASTVGRRGTPPDEPRARPRRAARRPTPARRSVPGARAFAVAR